MDGGPLSSADAMGTGEQTVPHAPKPTPKIDYTLELNELNFLGTHTLDNDYRKMGRSVLISAGYDPNGPMSSILEALDVQNPPNESEKFGYYFSNPLKESPELLKVFKDNSIIISSLFDEFLSLNRETPILDDDAVKILAVKLAFVCSGSMRRHETFALSKLRKILILKSDSGNNSQQNTIKKLIETIERAERSSMAGDIYDIVYDRREDAVHPALRSKRYIPESWLQDMYNMMANILGEGKNPSDQQKHRYKQMLGLALGKEMHDRTLGKGSTSPSDYFRLNIDILAKRLRLGETEPALEIDRDFGVFLDKRAEKDALVQIQNEMRNAGLHQRFIDAVSARFVMIQERQDELVDRDRIRNSFSEENLDPWNALQCGLAICEFEQQTQGAEFAADVVSSMFEVLKKLIEQKTRGDSGSSHERLHEFLDAVSTYFTDAISYGIEEFAKNNFRQEGYGNDDLKNFRRNVESLQSPNTMFGEKSEVSEDIRAAASLIEEFLQSKGLFEQVEEGSDVEEVVDLGGSQDDRTLGRTYITADDLVNQESARPQSSDLKEPEPEEPEEPGATYEDVMESQSQGTASVAEADPMLGQVRNAALNALTEVFASGVLVERRTGGRLSASKKTELQRTFGLLERISPPDSSSEQPNYGIFGLGDAEICIVGSRSYGAATFVRIRLDNDLVLEADFGDINVSNLLDEGYDYKSYIVNLVDDFFSGARMANGRNIPEKFRNFAFRQGNFRNDQPQSVVLRLKNGKQLDLMGEPSDGDRDILVQALESIQRYADGLGDVSKYSQDVLQSSRAELQERQALLNRLVQVKGHILKGDNSIQHRLRQYPNSHRVLTIDYLHNTRRYRASLMREFELLPNGYPDDRKSFNRHNSVAFVSEPQGSNMKVLVVCTRIYASTFLRLRLNSGVTVEAYMGEANLDHIYKNRKTEIEQIITTQDMSEQLTPDQANFYFREPNLRAGNIPETLVVRDGRGNLINLTGPETTSWGIYNLSIESLKKLVETLESEFDSDRNPNARDKRTS